MTKYIILEYAQPRPANYNKEVVIFEKKTETLKLEDIESFLRESYVICGGVMHHRLQISLMENLPPTPRTTVRPDHDFLNLGDEFPKK